MRPTAVAKVSQDELTSYRLDPRQAVRAHDIVCLVCGGVFRQLTNTHVASHRMTSVEYKLQHGYNLGRALMCHALRRVYAERAVRTRFADRIRRRPILENPELRRKAGTRSIALEEFLTRQDVQQTPRRRWDARDRQGRFVPVGARGGGAVSTRRVETTGTLL
ncbi:MAG TPA: MucR family transcriptional regulator [Methylomirabilota bacterium]|nr:MucR family transcriptional regulator [Methylomirabilota bacterium]